MELDSGSADRMGFGETWVAGTANPILMNGSWNVNCDICFRACSQLAVPKNEA